MFHVILREVRPEFINVKPEVCVGIELYCVGIAQDVICGEATADMPEGRRERAARLVLWSVSPEETNQPIAGLGSVAMEDQVSQQGLGFEGGRLGQRLVFIADV
jgi:hypothetical protein